MIKILIVDDIEENRVLIENYLKTEGYDVLFANNGLDALNILNGEKVDLIISDILMPQMDGFSFCRKVKSDINFKEIPFVFYTATYTDEQDEKLALNLGASKFIVKPKEKDEFNKLIKEVLNSFNKGEIEVKNIEEEVSFNFYKLYNEVLIRKLEKKMIDIEEKNKKLKDEIDEKEKVKKELDKNVNYLNNIIEILPMSLVIIDENFNIKKYNKIFYDNFGEEKEILNKNLFDINSNFSKNKDLRLLFNEMMNDDFEINNYEFQFFDKNYNNKIYNVRAVKVESGDESKKSIIVILEDHTEKKKIISESIIMQNQIQHLQKIESIGKFTAGIAHDFNNILTVIINSSELLMESLGEDNSYYEDLKNIYDASMKGSELTKKLLLFSRREESKKQMVDVHRTLLDFEKIINRFVGENIKIKFELNSVDSKIFIDPLSFEQVILNLISNSKDAMPDGGEIKIKTKSEEFTFENDKKIIPGKYIKIEISDTGKGIEKEIINRIFDPFFTTKKEGKGTGLGLYLVSSIIDSASGYIYVCSSPNNGTTFNILLPVASSIEEENTTINNEESISLLNFGNILIVEDNIFVLNIICKLFDKFGVKYHKALSAKEAINMCNENKCIPDLLITDIILSDMTGDALTRIMKEGNKELKVLFMSGYNIDDLKSKKINIDERCLIQKPFSIKDFIKKLNEINK